MSNNETLIYFTGTQPTTNSIDLILRNSKAFTLCRINTTQRRLSSIFEHCGWGARRASNYWSTTFWVTIYRTRCQDFTNTCEYFTEQRRRHGNTETHMINGNGARPIDLTGRHTRYRRAAVEPARVSFWSVDDPLFDHSDTLYFDWSPSLRIRSTPGLRIVTISCRDCVLLAPRLVIICVLSARVLGVICFSYGYVLIVCDFLLSDLRGLGLP